MVRPIVLVWFLLGLLTLACGGGSQPPEASVQIATLTPVVQGNGSATPAVVATPVASPETPAAVAPTSPSGNASTDADRPVEGRWIDVDVATFEVRLMDGATVLQAIGPIAVGVQVDTGNYESTQTGLFHVYAMTEDLSYDAPYGVYISHWVGFDFEKANGFHSFLKDADGAVVDDSTGRVSNGCIRTGDPEAIYAFAEIGMPVYVHS